MKKKILIQIICGFILQLMVCANVLSHDFNSLGINIESVNNNLADNVNATQVNTTCDVILNFSNMGFTHIGSNFINSLYVKNLTLRNNSITEFEKGAFDSLPNLEYLDASRNQLSLTALFTFGGHLNLKTLILDYNCLYLLCLPKVNDADLVVSDPHKRIIRSLNQYYPDYDYYTDKPKSYRHRLEINPSYYFPELENLSLRKINADSLSADWSFNFPKLKYLDLSENSFYEPSINIYNNIPPTTLHLLMESANLRGIKSQNFKNITMLNLNHNYFYKVSNRFCTEEILCLQSLHNLQSLSAANCSISVIDVDAFKDTATLLELDISNNNIVDVPKEIFQNIPSLVHLDLSKNNLNEIPDFGALKNLSSLKLDNMQNLTIFNSMSSFSFLPNLTTISMRKNNLKNIPQSFFDNLPALREIDLSHNEITSLPAFMSQATLSKLYLSFNRVVDIGDLSLTNLRSLEILDLRNNFIFCMKIGSLQMLPSNALLYL